MLCLYLAQNAAVHAINFFKTNSINDGVFLQFCESTVALPIGEMVVKRPQP